MTHLTPRKAPCAHYAGEPIPLTNKVLPFEGQQRCVRCRALLVSSKGSSFLRYFRPLSRVFFVQLWGREMVMGVAEGEEGGLICREVPLLGF